MPMWGYICFTNRYKGTYFYFTLRGAILLMLLGWYWRSEYYIYFCLLIIHNTSYIL